MFLVEQTRIQIQKLVISAMLLAVGIVLPFFTGQIPRIGNMLLPMHLPALVCGLICGWQYGGTVGAVLPLFRYALFGMPPMPNGIAMAFELAAYGILAGICYSRSRWNCMTALYRSLFIAMIGGRVVWGVASIIIMGLSKSVFTWQMFIAGACFNAIPGIILQLLFIPALMAALDKTGVISMGHRVKNVKCPEKNR